METKRERLWKAAVENATRLPQHLTHNRCALRARVSYRRGFQPDAYMACHCPLGSGYRMPVEMRTRRILVNVATPLIGKGAYDGLRI